VSIIKHGQEQPRTLAERVRAALDQQQPAASAPPAKPACLILDVSGSMAEACEPGRSKIDALRQIVAGLGKTGTIYAFSDDCEEVTAAKIPDPYGNTFLAPAFAQAKHDGHITAVLITDGLPHDGPAALRAVRGLTLQIFYVGPAPMPVFLRDLARAAGGQSHQADLRRPSQPLLQTKIRALLNAPR